jgi:type IV pilus assembly protein PilB
MPTKASWPKLAAVLLQAELLSEAQLQDTVDQAQKSQQQLIVYVLQHFPISPSAISKACAEFFGLPHQELLNLTRETLPLELINEKMIQLHCVLPIAQHQQQLQVAVSDPDDFALLENIQYQTGLHVQAIMVPYDQLSQLISRLLSIKEYFPIDSRQHSAVDFVEKILNDAIRRNASDIHCEPFVDSCRVRMRIDGILHEITHAPSHLSSQIISRLKILGQCDIAERRLPQDGRFSFTSANGYSRDCRLSTCPTIFGEKIVVRLLDANKKLLSIDELGLSDHDQSIFLQSLSQPQGLILVTGPTGSGKTITLYTALEHLNRNTLNISTVEEPVEIQLAGINQVNIHEKAGLGFAQVLRAFLRQDPDIIMVGEIRDKETAEIAIRAAQTGHLVLSTLHTNSAAETLTRLLNMEIAPFNLASALRLVIAQRLVRKLCTYCRGEKCHQCVDGYRGRQGLFELMPISKHLTPLILQANTTEIFQQAVKEGMQSLWDTALQKVQEGVTTMEEIYRVVAHD